MAKKKTRFVVPAAKAAASGFCLKGFNTQTFSDRDAFTSALADQWDAVDMVDGSDLQAVGLDGEVSGSCLRLSDAAFADVCSFSKMPVGFIKRLAQQDETMALEVVQRCLHSWYAKGAPKSFVVDTREDLVLGVVGTNTYAPVDNLDVVGHAFEAAPNLTFVRGLLAGPRMRFEAETERMDVNPKVGDPVAAGVMIGNAINGDSSLRVHDCYYRLVCKNGMIGRESQHAVSIIHRGNALAKMHHAVTASAGRTLNLFNVMKAAATAPLEPIREAFWAAVANPQYGGSKKLVEQAKAKATQEAADEGHENEVTVWNAVNGVTWQAHEKTLDSRSRLEALGFATLARFGVTLDASGK